MRYGKQGGNSKAVKLFLSIKFFQWKLEAQTSSSVKNMFHREKIIKFLSFPSTQTLQRSTNDTGLPIRKWFSATLRLLGCKNLLVELAAEISVYYGTQTQQSVVQYRLPAAQCQLPIPSSPETKLDGTAICSPLLGGLHRLLCVSNGCFRIGFFPCKPTDSARWDI